MKKAILIVLIVITALLLAFGVYLLVDEEARQRDLRNYPVAYADLIAANAEEFGLDPYLVLAVMRCESSFDPEAVSNRGAKGLMQIMPDTGSWIAHKLDLDDSYEESMLFDPAVNIRFGCWYLRFVGGRFDGNVKCMVAAYNAGHKTVENWLEDPAYGSGGTLLTIPYESTAAYYERVTTSLDRYRALYPTLFGEPGSPAEPAGTVAGNGES